MTFVRDVPFAGFAPSQYQIFLAATRAGASDLNSYIWISDFTQVTLITVSLSGSQELPPVQTAGTATANLGINFNTGLMTGTVTFSGLTGNAIAAHFHLAPAGFNGSIDLDALEGGLGGTSGVMNVAAGTILNQNQFDQLISDQYYINVHTTTNTNGEIRGQVIFPPGAATSLTGSRLP